MLNVWVASGKMPLLAVTVPSNVPEVVGVPSICPETPSVRPAGRAPEVTLYSIGAVPVAA
jgi:hypothetical protein